MFTQTPQPGKSYDIHWSTSQLSVSVNWDVFSLRKRLKAIWLIIRGCSMTISGPCLSNIQAKNSVFSLKEVPPES